MTPAQINDAFEAERKRLGRPMTAEEIRALDVALTGTSPPWVGAELATPAPSMDRTPAEMREDASMWSRAGYPQVAVGRYRAAADQIERLERLIVVLEEKLDQAAELQGLEP